MGQAVARSAEAKLNASEGSPPAPAIPRAASFAPLSIELPPPVQQEESGPPLPPEPQSAPPPSSSPLGDDTAAPVELPPEPLSAPPLASPATVAGGSLDLQLLPARSPSPDDDWWPSHDAPTLSPPPASFSPLDRARSSRGGVSGEFESDLPAGSRLSVPHASDSQGLPPGLKHRTMSAPSLRLLSELEMLDVSNAIRDGLATPQSPALLTQDLREQKLIVLQSLFQAIDRDAVREAHIEARGESGALFFFNHSHAVVYVFSRAFLLFSSLRTVIWLARSCSRGLKMSLGCSRKHCAARALVCWSW